MELVERGLCYIICDYITAAGYNMSRHSNPGIIFRPFKPVVSSSFSIITPAHKPQSQLAKAFVELLATNISQLEKMVLGPNYNCD